MKANRKLEILLVICLFFILLLLLVLLECSFGNESIFRINVSSYRTEGTVWSCTEYKTISHWEMKTGVYSVYDCAIKNKCDMISINLSKPPFYIYFEGGEPAGPFNNDCVYNLCSAELSYFGLTPKQDIKPVVIQVNTTTCVTESLTRKAKT